MWNLINKPAFKNKKILMNGAYGQLYLINYNNKPYVIKKIKNNMYYNEEYTVANLIKPNSSLCKCLYKYRSGKWTYL